MKSFFDEFFSVDGFGNMKLFDFPFNTDAKEDENDGKSHTYFHKVADKYDELGQRISHVEKEVKDGKVLKDIKEEPKLQVALDGKDALTSVNIMDELNALKKEHEQLKGLYDELQQKYSNLNEVYTNTCNRLKDICNALEGKNCNNEGKE